MTWRIDELLDLEAALLADKALLLAGGGRSEAIQARDRALGQSIRQQGQSAGGDDYLQAWVEARRLQQTDLPGRQIWQRWMLLRWVLRLLVVLLGAGMGVALLHFDGSAPVNIIAVLVALVLVPSALLVVTLVAQVPVLLRHGSRLGGPLPGMLLAGLRRLLIDERHYAGLIGQLLRRRGGHYLYADCARWQLLALLQELAALLFAAALLGMWWVALGNDLAFGWHSTLLDASDIRRWSGWLSWPWQQLWPAAVPDEQLIEASRYVLLENRFQTASGEARSADAAQLHRWWPFLMACVACWTLLPRLLVLAICRYQARRSLAAVQLDYEDHQRLATRLRGEAEPSFAPRGPVCAPDNDAEPMPDSAEPWPQQAYLLRWLAAPGLLTGLLATVPAQRQWTDLGMAGADVDLSADRQIIARIATAPLPVICVIDAEEPPMAEVLQWLRELAAASHRPVHLYLIGVDDAVEVWREAVARAQLPVQLRWAAA